MKILYAFIFLLIATSLEVTGDAAVRAAIYNHAGLARFGFMIVGALLLFGYGFALNMAPLEFGQVVGLYIATLFVMWQIINFIVFKSVPTVPILIGGGLIILGGLIVSFYPSDISHKH